MRRFALLGIALAATLAPEACVGKPGNDASKAPTDAAHTLTVLAGSELRDLEPYFNQIREHTGISLVPTYTGTLTGVDRINAGDAFDAAWFANAKYLLLDDRGHRVKAQQRIMLSPVILGVKRSRAAALGWDRSRPRWQDIASRAASGNFTYAITNPTASNSGFSTVIGVAAALAGSQDVLRATDVDRAKLTGFFRGQRLTAGSSAWLIDAYVREQEQIDGIFNYEASLLALQRSGKLRESLTLIYPKEGVITSDYPFLLLNDAKRDAYDRVVAYLKGADFQRLLMEKTFRRPVIPDVPLDSNFPTKLVNELPFPNSLATVDAILISYLNENRIPPHSYFVLDTSGSMEGDRISGVRSALGTLAGDDPSLTGRFARFENREKITLISFNSDVSAPVNLEMHATNDPATLKAVHDYATHLTAGGNTAIYSALDEALADAAHDRKSGGDRYVSIVLMTDGENNRGETLDQFRDRYNALAPDSRVKVFPILFGEGNAGDLQELATITGGRMFDGRTDSLSNVFKEIRGYQ